MVAKKALLAEKYGSPDTSKNLGFRVPHRRAGSPQFFLTSGNVTMEDTQLVHASGPTQTAGPGHSLDSGVISSVGVKEVVKECMQVDSSRVSPQEGGVTSSSIIAEQLLPEVSSYDSIAGETAVGGVLLEHCKDGGAAGTEVTSQHSEDGGAAVLEVIHASAHEQGCSPCVYKDLVVESTTPGGPDIQLVSNACSVGAITSLGPPCTEHGLDSGQLPTTEGESYPNSSAQPVIATHERSDSQERENKVKQEIELFNSCATDGLENGKLMEAKSVTEGEKQADVNEFPSTEETSLMGVLGKLISLDPSEIFKDPVDDSFAPKYSKIIKNPMCFSMMQEKIGMGHYPSWCCFVEDFERICYNAMKYNQKRSKIWNAASTLLRQGKKILEAYADHGDNLSGIMKVVEDADKTAFQAVPTGSAAQLVEDKSALSHQASFLEGELMLKPNSELSENRGVTIPSTELELLDSEGRGGDPALPCIIGKDEISQNVAVPPDVRDAVMRQYHEVSEGYAGGISNQLSLNHVNEDVKVEILESTGSEDVRPDSRDEATECSSSFGCTQSTEKSDGEIDGIEQNAEVESELRDGNGALIAAFAEDDEIARGNRRGKKPLNADWKKFRRGMEWRCRWLTIRMNELRKKADQYQRLLEEKGARKAWINNGVQPGEESSARTAQMVDRPDKEKILRRLRRKHSENQDTDVYMTAHPIYSIFGTDTHEMDDPCVEAKTDLMQHRKNQQKLAQEFKDSEEWDTQEVGGWSSVRGGDSMEQIIWKAESLQARLEKAKAQLLMGAPPKLARPPLTIPKPPNNLSRGPLVTSPRASAPGTVPRPSDTKGRQPAGLSPGLLGTPPVNGAPHKQVSAPLRRKSADYDIDNVVMTVSVGTKYVEHIKHADIWTPHWRLIEDADAAYQSLGGNSSDENTDDEKFDDRHLEMEVNERKQRYMLPPKRSPDGEPTISGKRGSKSGMGKGAGKLAGRGTFPTKVTAAIASEFGESSVLSAFAGSIPKGKRKKRQFNATAFNTNRAQRFSAYLAEPTSSSPSPEPVEEGILIADRIEARPSEETNSERKLLAQIENSVAPPLISADQVDLKRKRSASFGLQVLANP